MNNFDNVPTNGSEEWQDAVISISRDGETFQQYLDVQSTVIHNHYTNRQLLQALVSKATMKITGVDRLPDDLGAQFTPETNELCVRRFMEFADTFQCMATELAYAELISGSDVQATRLFLHTVLRIFCAKNTVLIQKDSIFLLLLKCLRGWSFRQLRVSFPKSVTWQTIFLLAWKSNSTQ